MTCPNCKKVIPEESERCPECLVNIEAFNRETSLYRTEKRSKFISTAIMFMIICSLILAIICFIAKAYLLGFLVLFALAPEIFLLEIAKTTIDLLQEISQKLDR